jgi:hypothetical protein
VALSVALFSASDRCRFADPQGEDKNLMQNVNPPYSPFTKGEAEGI